jgi:hypothetical protein
MPTTSGSHHLLTQIWPACRRGRIWKRDDLEPSTSITQRGGRATQGDLPASKAIAGWGSGNTGLRKYHT